MSDDTGTDPKLQDLYARARALGVLDENPKLHDVVQRAVKLGVVRDLSGGSTPAKPVLNPQVLQSGGFLQPGGTLSGGGLATATSGSISGALGTSAPPPLATGLQVFGTKSKPAKPGPIFSLPTIPTPLLTTSSKRLPGTSLAGKAAPVKTDKTDDLGIAKAIKSVPIPGLSVPPLGDIPGLPPQMRALLNNYPGAPLGTGNNEQDAINAVRAKALLKSGVKGADLSQQLGGLNAQDASDAEGRQALLRAVKGEAGPMAATLAVGSLVSSAFKNPLAKIIGGGLAGAATGFIAPKVGDVVNQSALSTNDYNNQVIQRQADEANHPADVFVGGTILPALALQTPSTGLASAPELIAAYKTFRPLGPVKALQAMVRSGLIHPDSLINKAIAAGGGYGAAIANQLLEGRPIDNMEAGKSALLLGLLAGKPTLIGRSLTHPFEKVGEYVGNAGEQASRDINHIKTRLSEMSAQQTDAVRAETARNVSNTAAPEAPRPVRQAPAAPENVPSPYAMEEVSNIAPEYGKMGLPTPTHFEPTPGDVAGKAALISLGAKLPPVSAGEEWQVADTPHEIIPGVYSASVTLHDGDSAAPRVVTWDAKDPEGFTREVQQLYRLPSPPPIEREAQHSPPPMEIAPPFIDPEVPAPEIPAPPLDTSLISGLDLSPTPSQRISENDASVIRQLQVGIIQPRDLSVSDLSGLIQVAQARGNDIESGHANEGMDSRPWFTLGLLLSRESISRMPQSTIGSTVRMGRAGEVTVLGRDGDTVHLQLADGTTDSISTNKFTAITQHQPPAVSGSNETTPVADTASVPSPPVNVPPPEILPATPQEEPLPAPLAVSERSTPVPADRPHYVNANGKFVEVFGASPVTLKGHEDLDLFVHPTLGDNKKFTITEGKTGTSLSHGDTITQAIAVLEGKLSARHSAAADVASAIESQVAKNGLSPRHAGEVPAIRESPAAIATAAPATSSPAAASTSQEPPQNESPAETKPVPADLVRSTSAETPKAAPSEDVRADGSIGSTEAVPAPSAGSSGNGDGAANRPGAQLARGDGDSGTAVPLSAERGGDAGVGRADSAVPAGGGEVIPTSGTTNDPVASDRATAAQGDTPAAATAGAGNDTASPAKPARSRPDAAEQAKAADVVDAIAAQESGGNGTTQDATTPEEQGLRVAPAADPNEKPTKAEVAVRQPAVAQGILSAPPTGPNLRLSLDQANAVSLTTQGQKASALLNSLRLLKQIEGEGRLATPDEQAILASFPGWGWTGNYLNPKNALSKDASIQRFYRSVRDLLTPEEMNAAVRSAQNSHYTAPEIIQGMYDALGHLGVKGGGLNFLEPSAGSGLFFGLMPDSLLQKSSLRAVELDSLTGRLLKQIYQGVDVQIKGYQEARFPTDYFDVIASNVPFGNIAVSDPAFAKQTGAAAINARVHNYFFAKAMSQVRPGGVIAFITSHGTLDAKDVGGIATRRYLAAHGDLLGAIRLPKTAFSKNAGTEVTTDIVFLRKRLPGEEAGGEAFTNLVPATGANGKPLLDGEGKPFLLNEYFANNPKQALGIHSMDGSMRKGGGMEYSLLPHEGKDLGELLAGAIRRLPKGGYRKADRLTPQQAAAAETASGGVTAAQKARSARGGKSARAGSLIVDKGEVFINIGDTANPILQKQEVDAKDLPVIQSFTGLRDVLHELIEAQKNDLPLSERNALRKKLAGEYDAFTAAHGPVHGKALRTFIEDPDAYGVLALEQWDTKTRTVTGRADIFTRDVITPNPIVSAAETPEDALTVSLRQSGGVDMAAMGELTGQDGEAIARHLNEKGLIYKDAAKGWVLTEEYGSGNVRKKLAAAQQLAQSDPSYAANVAYLETVQPRDLKASEITVGLGANWVPVDVVKSFLKHLGGGRFGTVEYSSATAKWKVAANGDVDYVTAGTKWGTSSLNSPRLLQLIMNGGEIKVADRDGKIVPNETAAAQAKADEIKDEWSRWVYEDAERASRLVGIYNRDVNVYAPRKYDGSHLRGYPGQNPLVFARGLRPHQDNAVWRSMQDKAVLLAHDVGTGKTATMQTSAMELRRTGLRRKPLHLVMKSTIGQYAAAFRRLYPGAKLLVADEQNFSAAKRKEFMAKIATGDWDSVIMWHNAFKELSVSPSAAADFYEEQIDTLRQFIDAAQRQGGDDSFTVKEGARKLDNLETKLKNLKAKMGEFQDDANYFDDLGIDQIYVDESQTYKNLEIQSNFDGLGNEGNDITFDMLMKLRMLQKAGGGVVFASGTPLTNSISEIYSILRYLAPDTLKEQNIAHFDEWARQFARSESVFAQDVAGRYRNETRFAAFHNVGEMLQQYRAVVDQVLAEDIPGLLRPRLIDRDGKVTDAPIIVESSPNPEQMRYFADMVHRAETVPNRFEAMQIKEAGGIPDTFLKISTDGRMVSQDARMRVGGAFDDPGSKINKLVEAVLWEHNDAQNSKDKRTQLVFLDQGVPGGEGFDLYTDITRKLIKAGVPKSEIAWIYDAKNDDQRAALFAKVSSGAIRILLGSRKKMGVGVNVQERLIAIHQADPTWRPDEIEQADGRILRQGNEFVHPDTLNLKKGDTIPAHTGVRIYEHVNKGSFDGFMWGKVSSKKKFIKQLLGGSIDAREIEDLGTEGTFDLTQMQAVSTGDPRIEEFLTLRDKVKRLSELQKSHASANLESFQRAQLLQTHTIPKLEKANGALQSLIRYAADNTPAKFTATLRGATVTERKVVGEKILAVAAGMETRDPAVEVGTFNGFTLSLTMHHQPGMDQVMPRVGLIPTNLALPQEAATSSKEMRQGNEVAAVLLEPTAPVGVAARLENALRGFQGRFDDNQDTIERMKADIPKLQEAAKAVFPKEEELVKARDRFKVLDAEIGKDMAGANKGGFGKTLGQPAAVLPTGGGQASPVRKLSRDITPAFYAPSFASGGSTTPRIAPDPLTGGESVKSPADIVLDLSKALGKAVETDGRKGKANRARFAGMYYPGTGRTVVTKANDLDTTAHETAHALDDRHGIVAEWADVAKGASPFDAELIPAFSQHGSIPKVSIVLESTDPATRKPALVTRKALEAGEIVAGAYGITYGKNPVSDDSEYTVTHKESGTASTFDRLPDAVRFAQEMGRFEGKALVYTRAEGVAEWLRAWMVNPNAAVAAAPAFAAHFERNVPGADRAALRAFGDEIRRYVGQSSAQKIGANVQMEKRDEKSPFARLKAFFSQNNGIGYQTSGMDRLRLLITDDLAPFESATRHLRKVMGQAGKFDILPVNDPILRARQLAYFKNRIDSIFRYGMVNAQDQLIGTPFADVFTPLLTPDVQTYDQMIAETTEAMRYIIADRVVDEAGKLDREAAGRLKSLRETADKRIEKVQKTATDQETGEAKERIRLGVRLIKKRATTLAVERELVIRQTDTALADQKVTRMKSAIQGGVSRSTKALATKEMATAKERADKAVEKETKRVNATYARAEERITRQGESRKGRLIGAGAGIEAADAISADALAQLAKSDPSKLARYRDFGARLRRQANDVLLYAKEKGRISQDEYDNIVATNEWYVPLKRILDETPIELVSGKTRTYPTPSGGKSLVSAKAVVKEFHGSTRTIQNPIVSVLEQMYATVKEADRNEVLQNFISLIPQGRTMHEGQPLDLTGIATPVEAGTPGARRVFIDGKAQYWRFEAGIDQSLQRVGEVHLPDILEAALMFPASLLRTTATKTPGYLVRNKIRDVAERLFKSRTADPLTPQGVLNDIKDSVKPTTEEERYLYGLLGGGMSAAHYLDRASDFYALQHLLLRQAAKGPQSRLAWAHKLVARAGDIQEAVERSTRIAEYRSAKRVGEKAGLDEQNTALFAMNEARDLQDFAKGGKWTKSLNRYVAFTNAQVIGLTRLGSPFYEAYQQGGAKSAGKAGAQALAKLLLYFALPAVGALLLAKSQGKDTLEEYRQFPAYLRDMFYLVKVGPNQWVCIPKPHEVGVVGSGVERGIDYAMGNKNAFDGYAESLGKQFFPLDESILMGGGFKTYVELMTNYDTFRNAPIIPPAQNDMAVELRHGTEHASRLGQSVGGKLNLDPRKVDYFVGHTGNDYGKGAMLASDIGRADQPRAGDTLARLLMGNVVRESPGTSSRSVQAVKGDAAEGGVAKDLLQKERAAYYAATTNAEREAAARALRAKAASQGVQDAIGKSAARREVLDTIAGRGNTPEEKTTRTHTGALMTAADKRMVKAGAPDTAETVRSAGETAKLEEAIIAGMTAPIVEKIPEGSPLRAAVEKKVRQKVLHSLSGASLPFLKEMAAKYPNPKEVSK